MRRYKLAVHILIIFSVFNFVPVLAAPVPVQEEREVGTDVVDGSEGVIIASGKRAEEGQGLWSGYHGLTQASTSSESESTSSLLPPGSPSASGYASGVHQETTNPTQLPSSTSDEVRRPPYVSGGTELPWYTSGETRRPSYAKGGTELPWYSSSEMRGPSSASGGIQLPSSSSGEMRKPPYASGGTELHLLTPGHGRVQQIQSGTTSRIPASSVRTKTYKWIAPSSVRTKTDKWVPTENEPASSSSGEITPASSSKVPPQSKQEGYLAQTPTKQPKPQSESFLSDLASKSKFRPRISATAGGAVNAAQRELLGTVHTEAVTL